jgi:5-methyltetrahydropteroyltriglutamate--homocysteine methyltransferase
MVKLLRQSSFVEDAKFYEQTNKPIKWALPGPLTMVRHLSDNYYKVKKKIGIGFAKALNEERELQDAG